MNDARERMRRIRDEDQRMNLRGYNADPWGRHRLEGQRHEGVPVERSNALRNATFEQDAEGWWINKPTWGPFQSIRDAELAVFGRSDLQGGRRDWRDGAPKAGE
jgi:hypothetical protein